MATTKRIFQIGLLLTVIFLNGCVTSPAANMVSWDGQTGKVRQGLWGPIHEHKVDPEMDKLMAQKCPNGYTVTKEGSDIVGAYPGPAEAKFKEFKCK